METQVAFRYEITTRALPQSPIPMNFVHIVFHHVTRDFIEDPSGVQTFIGVHMDPPTAPILLGLPSSAPCDIYQLLCRRIEDPLLCQQLASDIAISANRMGFGLRDLKMFVNMTLIMDRFFLVQGSSPPRGASEALLRRLVEEQNFDSADGFENPDLESEPCSICLEELVGSETLLLQMSSCSHVFHRDCVVDWLKRTNSCPLCRNVPYKDDETE